MGGGRGGIDTGGQEEGRNLWHAVWCPPEAAVTTKGVFSYLPRGNKAGLGRTGGGGEGRAGRKEMKRKTHRVSCLVEVGLFSKTFEL